jgi:hypothetical protein
VEEGEGYAIRLKSSSKQTSLEHDFLWLIGLLDASSIFFFFFFFNDSTYIFFNSSIGLKNGFTLFPLLFLIIRLRRVISKRNGAMKSIKI